MLAMIWTVVTPILPLLGWKLGNKEKKQGKGELLLRYAVYGLIIVFVAALLLAVTSDDDTSFWVKIAASGSFALKYICMVTAAALMVTVLEWLWVTKGIGLKIYEKKFAETKKAAVFGRYLAPLALYLLAAVVIFLNVRLMFDNVVWGDEAFSVNTAKKTVYGILQVMYYWDNHPPLHYYWLKLFGELFGFSIPVMHLASMVPFFAGIVLAVTAFRKKFGNLPAAIFVLISGLGPACLEYNLEIRMYSLAFWGILAAFYCTYQILGEEKRRAWVGLVIWGLVAAYSHYYALVAAGILVFLTGAAYWLKNRGKSWKKGLLALVLFVVGYAPWMYFLYTATSNVSGNWWVTSLLGMDRVLNMVLGNDGMRKILMPLWFLLLVALLLAESGIFRLRKDASEDSEKEVKNPVKNWSVETYTCVVGALTVAGTIVFAYLLCFVMKQNVLQERYLYPVTAVVIAMLMVASSRLFSLLGNWEKQYHAGLLQAAGKVAILVSLAIVLSISVKNYKEYEAQSLEQDEATRITLEIIGEPGAEVNMVSNGVNHLAWTVLYHYYPDNEIISGGYGSAKSDKFWYFVPEALDEAELIALEASGYKVTSYGENMLAKYPFELYYMEKVQDSSVAADGQVSGNVWIVTQHGPRDINSSFYTLHNTTGNLIVVDGGWEEDAAYVRETISSLGGKVDAWIITHPHVDHIGAFNKIYADPQGIEIQDIYTAKMPSPKECLASAYWDDISGYETFLALAPENLHYVSAGEVLTVCGLELHIYSAYDEFMKELTTDYLNDGSLMFEVMGEKESFLFCADVGPNLTETLMEKWGEALRADYLQMGHHGYGGLRHEFYREVQPEISFFDAPESMMKDTTGTYNNIEQAALMESLGSEIVSFQDAPYSVVLE